MKPWNVFRVDRYPGYWRRLESEWILPHMLRHRGVRVGGRPSVIGWPIVSIAPGSTIEIGDGTVLCSDGNRTALGVSHPVILRTIRPAALLRIGAGVRMSGCTICAAVSVVIEDGVCIGSGATIVDTDFHALNWRDRAGTNDGELAGCSPVRIGAGAFLGGGSYILKGVTIGAGAVVGAAAVVTQDVEAGSVVAGNPAREVRRVPERAERG